MCTAQAQRPGGFRVLGPGGGGATYHPAISPHDAKTALVSCDMSGAYITHDGGQSWRMFNLRSGQMSFAFDPVDAKVIYAYGLGLWRSTDAGATWALIAPRPSKVRGIANAEDEGEVSILADEDASDRRGVYGRVTALGIDPLDSKRMYVAVGEKTFSSSDGGARWSEMLAPVSGVARIAVVHRAGEKDSIVVLAGYKGIAAGGAMVPLPPGVTRTEDQVIDVVDGRALLMVVANRQLYQTWLDFAGRKPRVDWHLSSMPGDGTKVTLAASGHDGRTLYASFSKMKMVGREWDGIAKSEDLGQHWAVIWKDSGDGASNLNDAWLTESFDSDWGEEPLGIAVAPSDHNVVYTTDLGRVMKSVDGGAHWTAAYSHVGADGGWTSNGLDVTSSNGVYFDPFRAGRVFAGNHDVGLMRSDNGGESWRSSFEGVPKPWRSTTYAMIFDPAVKGRAWAAMSRNHDLPRPRMWRHTAASAFRGGVVTSEDGGLHWKPAGEGMPEAAVTDVVLDPRSSAGQRTLYAASMGRGVFKSTDGGRHWSAKNQGLPAAEVLAWQLALGADRNLYLVVARRDGSAAPGGPGDGALYRSRDAAESWERVALPAGVNGPNGLAIDPKEPWKMYLAAWGRNSGQHGEGGGIFATVDAGAHWTRLFAGDQHVSSVTVNPANVAEVYAVGFESSAWHSMDRGQHWTRIAGYNFKAGTRVTPDPAHGGMVYINTFGGGIWHGRVDGAPGVEDMVTKEVAP